jgi:hypothetical protein
MRIQLRKLSEERHRLAIIRAGGQIESTECETRSLLMHDLLHYAVESEAGLASGFWGQLEAGRTLADMNDRTGKAQGIASAELEAIEQLVGALHGVTKDVPADELVAGMNRFASALDATLPEWLTEELVQRVKERMRRLVGHWRATPHGAAMELEWPIASPASPAPRAGG